MTERGKGKNEAEGGKKEGPASAPLQRATHTPPPDPQRTTTPSRPRAPRAGQGSTGGAGPAPASPAPVAPHVTAAAAAPAGTCSLGRRWGWGWARRRAGAGRAGAGPSPVTSCGAAGAGAALQRLRRRRPRLARLPASLRPPGPAASASFAATPPLPTRRLFLLPLPPSPPRRRPGPPAGGRARGSSQEFPNHVTNLSELNQNDIVAEALVFKVEL